MTKPVQDYAVAPVPDGATVHGLQIAMIITGIGATLPMFTLGTQIAGAQGLKTSVGIVFLACGLVAVLGVFTSIVGARCRLSTYQVLAFSFGSRGAQLVNLMLAVMLIGWFATTADMLGGAVQHAIAGLAGREHPKAPYTLAALTLMTLTGIFGFRVMEGFVRITVPLLTALMGYVVWLAISRDGLAPALSRAGDHSLSSLDALSSVIGAIVLTAVLAPDLTRYARDDRNARLSVLGVAIGFPAALLLAAIPASICGRKDLMDVMTLLGIPGIAIVILVISTWTSNTSNLYSATLTLATLFPGRSTRTLGFWGAIVALGAAAGGIADYFIPLLIVLGILSAPLAGVYVVDFFILRGGRYAADQIDQLPAVRGGALAAWGLGAVCGLVATYSGYSLTRIPALDSILVAAIGHALLNGARLRRQPVAPEPAPRVEVVTPDFSFVIEVHVVAAPISGAYFLADVDAGRLNDTSIFRIVNMHNQPVRVPARIEVLQMGRREKDPAIPPVIAHETTGATGLRHRQGTVSLARFAPGAVYHSMFVCMRDEPALDEGGARNPDGLGFAAFGSVVEGFDHLRRLFDENVHSAEYPLSPTRLLVVRRVRPACGPPQRNAGPAPRTPSAAADETA